MPFRETSDPMSSGEIGRLLPYDHGELLEERREGQSISCRRTGTGPATLLLVHGGMCEASFWSLQIDALASGWTLITPDLAGHGASRGWDAGLGIAELARHVATSAGELAEGPLVMVGHSLGALVALEAARLVGSKVAGLVIVDFLHAGRVASPPPRPSGPDGPRGAMRAGMFTSSTDEDLRERVLDLMLSHDPSLVGSMQRAAMEYDAAGALRDLALLPVSFIFGGMRPVSADAIRAEHPEARIAIMPKSGHFPMLDEPTVFSSLLAAEADRMIGRVLEA